MALNGKENTDQANRDYFRELERIIEAQNGKIKRLEDDLAKVERKI